MKLASQKTTYPITLSPASSLTASQTHHIAASHRACFWYSLGAPKHAVERMCKSLTEFQLSLSSVIPHATLTSWQLDNYLLCLSQTSVTDSWWQRSHHCRCIIVFCEAHSTNLPQLMLPARAHAQVSKHNCWRCIWHFCNHWVFKHNALCAGHTAV